MIRKSLRVREIEKHLSDIADSLEIVENNMPSEFGEFKELGLVKDGLYKKIEFVIESIINICNIINSDLRLGVPDVEDNIIDNLWKGKIFDEKIIKVIREIKGFRNILVHKYGAIDDKRAFYSIKDGLKDFELIIREVEKFLKK
ncbi:MAG: DUF86 domain-containing protein [Nanoarchaeota archaeon]|nr:DUF86 domain-containing protein [Nanoarchaeota archaeon]MBU0977596.1 DUF86 domain-containing protein [Nanoarchaeota archaeon]